ncbi:hypothetical protein [Streptomyces sp. NPDC049040]|uniref:hypothetical protein n=1 Tax=Streptomyces sp. NPDC049040 TaxID=3365593 RepID=UPI0037136F0E
MAMAVPLHNLIDQRVAQSSLAPVPPAAAPFTNAVAQGVFIDNPWGTINVTGISRPTGAGSSGVQVSKTNVDGRAFQAVLSAKELMALGWSAGRPPAADVEQAYLGWGAERARRRPFYAVCDGFTCATIAMLTAKQSPLAAAGTTVEWFGMYSGGISGTGHAITVVNRAPGSLAANPATWGNGCVVVDQWYALQAGGNPSLYVNGPAADAVYVAWLTAPGNSLRLMAGFTAGAYPWLSVPTI